MIKRIVIGLMAMLTICTPAYASENDILDEIIKRQEAMQTIYEERVEEIEGYGILGDRRLPDKIQCTCYIEAGKPTCMGSHRMDGTIAAARQHLGSVAQVYYVNSEGGIGDFIGYYEVNDTGYGAPTGRGKSEYKGRKSLGTIEAGITIDFRKPGLKEAGEFMKDTFTGEGTTGSQVYVIFEDGEG